MILLELEIHDFKQFAGQHVFRPSTEGVIGIIGHNGAGKTTLFEAIEWCLYQPREIGLDEVPPRGRPGKPRVRVTMQDPHGGATFVVERALARSKTAKAEIYRADEPDKRIVEGSRQVSDYVSRTLIGLGHRAFVSTFFTRQKELTFFGNLKETDRRREVGRLLGMETIREAQKLIAEERGEFGQQAKLLARQFDEESAGRDFAAELEIAEERIGQLSGALAGASETLAAAEAAHHAAREETERLAGLERRDAALLHEIARIDGDIRAGASRRDGAAAELSRMDAAASERSTLAELAATLDASRLALQACETERERHLAAERLRSDRERAVRALSETVGHLRQAVADARAISLPGWQWGAADDAAPEDGATRLAGIAAAIDVDVLALRVEAIERAAAFAGDIEQAEAQLGKFQPHLQKLRDERQAKLAGGNPEEQRAVAAAERERQLQSIAAAETRARAVADERAKLNPVLERLLSQEAGATCPTCGRPIVADDIAVTIGVFRQQLEALTVEDETLRTTSVDAQRRATELEREAVMAAERLSAIATLDERIRNGEERIAETEANLARVRSALVEHLEAFGWSRVPSPDELGSARAELETGRRVASSRTLLLRLGASARQAITAEADAAAELSAIGHVSYDPETHAGARNAVKVAEEASVRVRQIDAYLTQRPEREREIAAAVAAIANLAAARDDLNEQRAALAFDPALLESARSSEARCVVAEREARDRRAAALAAHADAMRTRDALTRDQERIRGLAERAERRGREADELDRMYREFNAFEQYVADRLTPQLADYTSELLGAITEGKYSQVEFTSNYGIEVFDGSDEKFPVEEFSGGERDVIALCARLALSRLIGSQAANPPGFMVLDEVFGSLDRERRAQVLETFGSLAGSAEAFSQLFIISHVDDVRSSPIFNEVWRVAEGPDGVSRLENLNISGGFEDA